MIVLAGLLLSGFQFYVSHTKAAPAHGGSINIAVIGNPRFINPVLTQLSDTDRDLTEIIFSSLMKYDGNGNLVNDAAESYQIGDGGKIYEIYLKKNIKWQDGKNLNADDVIFTLQTIQNADYRSPSRSLWQGVEIEKIDDYGVRFKLKNPYAPFLQTLTFGIIPKHLWEGVQSSRFALHELNLKPIGSGPYKFKSYQKDTNGAITSLELESFDDYFNGRAYITKIVFKFYANETEAYSAFKKGEVDVFNFTSAKTWMDMKDKNNDSLVLNELTLPHYFAVFFNQSQNKLLAEKNVRQAIALGINKKELVQNIFGGYGQAIDSPLLPGMLGYTDQIKKYDYSPDEAKNLLASDGWKDVDDDGILEKGKDNQKLQFTLTTIDWPELSQTAQLIQTQLAAIGIKMEITTKNSTVIQNETIKPRQYDALLFGEVIGREPDLFHFWHSSQKKESGLNLSLYENSDVDKLLAGGLEDLDINSRGQKLQQVITKISEDLPAIFLFSPDYLFAIKNSIKGVDLKDLDISSTRFSQINNWYLSTTRVWK